MQKKTPVADGRIKWALLKKKRPGYMLHWYKDYGRQRGRRVGTMTAPKSQGSETWEVIFKWLYSTRKERLTWNQTYQAILLLKLRNLSLFEQCKISTISTWLWWGKETVRREPVFVNSRVNRVCASGHRKVSIVSVLTSVRIKRVDFRNCPLYTGVRIRRVFLQKLKFYICPLLIGRN